MSKAVDVIKHELKELIVPTLYFFIILHIVAIIRVLINRDSGVPLVTTVSIGIAALILGKAVLLTNALPFVDRFPHKPLIWNVCWKTLLYAVMASFIHYLERLYEAWKATHALGAANDKLLSETVWPHFWAVEILLLVLIFVYVVMNELTRAIGPHEVKVMFFGPMPDKPAPA